MQDEYKVVLATCMRLKVSAITSIQKISLFDFQARNQILQPLLNEVKTLIKALPDEFSEQKKFLEFDCSCCMSENVVYTYGMGLLVRDLDNLDLLINCSKPIPKNGVIDNTNKCKKIFISHSSKDKECVDSFVTLLTRGAGLSQDDIFCTSIDGLKITNGEDIRKHIQANVNHADYAILLISNNYKESEICLNEMGAVWAIDKKVKAYVFPDLQVESVGWLINNNAAEKLNDETALASLYEELQRFYKLPLSLTRWTAQAKAFCGKFNVNCRTP